VSRHWHFPRTLARLPLVLVVAASLAAQLPARQAQQPQTPQERLVAAMHGVSSNVIMDYVRELTSERFGGRLTGTAGYDSAAAEAIAKAKAPMKRSVLLLLFGAEEQGVAGSEYYVNHPVVPNAKIKAFINLESVGRGERIGVSSGKEYSEIFAAMARANDQYVHRAMVASSNLNLARPRQDAAHFLWAKIPTVSVGVGGAAPLPYPTYHTSKDTWQTLTPEIMEDLARITFLATLDLANR